MTKENDKPQTIKSIAVLCSGGDSPGMNCAIRSVVRTGIGSGLEIYGIQRGYQGLLQGNFRLMNESSVGNIIQKGGTMLQTSRCPEFFQKETRKEAANLLKRKNIDALVVIGGNGSFAGAMALHKEHNFPVVGIPGTIDNDISGTDYTIGFDTAVQTAVEAVDKIRDTAFSHERTFIVEVMGRKSPDIALHVGVCTGAENIILPHSDIDYKQISSDIERGIRRGKGSSILIVAEGEGPGLSYEVQKELKEKYSLPAHVCILGHIQRGGRPTAVDRFLASKMGFMAIKAIKEKNFPTGVVQRNGKITIVPLEECLGPKKEYEKSYMELLKALSI